MQKKETSASTNDTFRDKKSLFSTFDNCQQIKPCDITVSMILPVFHSVPRAVQAGMKNNHLELVHAIQAKFIFRYLLQLHMCIVGTFLSDHEAYTVSELSSQPRSNHSPDQKQSLDVKECNTKAICFILGLPLELHGLLYSPAASWLSRKFSQPDEWDH